MRHETRTAPDLLLATLLLSGLLATVDAAAATLEVTIEDVRSAEGRIMVQIVDSEAGFDGSEAPVAALLLDPVTPEVAFSVDLEPGEYGMRVMQDLDGDGAMDTNFVGMPTEPWAFSNNAVGQFGPPGWADVRFETTTAPGMHSVRLVH